MTDKRKLDTTSRLLLDIGIGREALATTLPKQGREDLRKLIEDGAYYDADGSTRNMMFIARTSKDISKTVLLMDLVAKEMHLMGKRVAMPSMEDLLVNGEGYQDYGKTVDYLFLTGFYMSSKNSTVYGTPRENERILRSLKRWHYHDNMGIAVYMDVGQSAAENWWPLLLLNFISRTSLAVRTTDV